MKKWVQNTWEYTAASWDSAMALVYFQEKKAEIFGKGYAVLQGLADLVVQSALARSLDALWPTYYISKANVRRTLELRVQNPPREVELNVEGARQHWNPIVKSGVYHTVRATQDRRSDGIHLRTSCSPITCKKMTAASGLACIRRLCTFRSSA